jgi:HTH-type transcriptional regulator / antitoxin HigA
LVTLLHELAHVVLRHSGPFLDSLDDIYDKDVDGVEREANDRACDWLIEPIAFEAFIAEHSAGISRAAILDFARLHQRHPGIILGQLRHQKLVPYNLYHSLLPKMKPVLHDWIDVA